MIVELGFAGVDWLVRETLKEAGDAVVLEPEDARAAVRAAAEAIAAGASWSPAERGGAASAAPGMNRRDQIKLTAAEQADFLHEQRVVICATNGVRGWPHLMPLWYVIRDGELWAWTYAKSQKVRNLERDPRATLQIEDGDTLRPAARA